MFCRVNTAPTRGHCLTLIKPRCRLDIRKYPFAHRIVDTWNSLDDNIIACDSINGFKCKIDRFLYGRGFILALSSFLPSQILYYTMLTYKPSSRLLDVNMSTGIKCNAIRAVL